MYEQYFVNCKLLRTENLLFEFKNVVNPIALILNNLLKI